MGDTRLVYINKIGQNWENEFIYEFLFSQNYEDVEGEYWDAFPADNQPEPPHKHFISEVGTLLTKINFHLIQESTSFGMFDAIDEVISLAWEDIKDYDEYPDNRIYFKYGETFDSIADKLYERDKVLKVKKKENYGEERVKKRHIVG